MEKLTYFILFPALLVGALGSQSLDGVPWPQMLAVILGVLAIAVTALLAWYRVRKSVSGPTFTSIFQGGVRFNTSITLAVAQAFFGFEGLTLAAVVAGMVIVLVNLLCVLVLLIYGKGEEKGMGPFVREIAVNPLVLACVVGWFLSLSGIGLPGVTRDIVEIVGRAALPLGLLAVGAALRPEAVPGHSTAIVTASTMQFIVKPASALLLLSIIGPSGIAGAVVLIAMMTPIAPSSYILARQLGGDAETMASIVTLQTALAFLVMPLVASFAFA